MTSTDFKTGPLSLEMFNHAATELNEKGIINLMDGLNMAYAAEFIYNGKPLPKGLFLDIMIEKTQMLVTHLKHIQPGLVLVVNLNDNVATLKLYDMSLEDSLKL